jgi:hypothetical protein
MPTSIKRLLFIDTNIWLDFYRSQNDAGIKLLAHVEAIKDQIIVTYQLESEFKSNRQAVLRLGLSNLKAPADSERPNILADAKTTAMIAKNIRDAEKRVDTLRRRLKKVISKPTISDPVYKTCQRIFHRDSPIVLNRENPARGGIRRRAFKRFLHGCPPRKRNDTSIGDAFNWEWMIQCAIDQNAELVIVSRDTDYGITIDKESYINDHLKQEFQERVSKKRKIQLYDRLTGALKHFEIQVTKAEEDAESDIVKAAPSKVSIGSLMREIGKGRPFAEAMALQDWSPATLSEFYSHLMRHAATPPVDDEESSD